MRVAEAKHVPLRIKVIMAQAMRNGFLIIYFTMLSFSFGTPFGRAFCMAHRTGKSIVFIGV